MTSRIRYPRLVPAIVSVLVLVLLLVWGRSNLFERVQSPPGTAVFGSQTVRARIINIVDEGEIVLNGRSQPYQVMNIEILEGPHQGQRTDVDYGRVQLRSDDARFSPGELLYVAVGETPDGVLNAHFVDYVRSGPLLVLLGTFVLAILVMGRWKGLGALAALAVSMLMIVGYIIPHILAGEDPVKVSLIGSMILLGLSLYLTYGWNLKTHASVISMLLTLVVTGLLTVLFVQLTRLTGYGDENTMYLMQFSSVQINARGLLLGGMIIGALGVLDDLVTSQSAAVVEIHEANPVLGFRSVFRKAMHVGQDHVAATVNTLVLAYTGASLPLLLLFTLGQGSFSFLVNSEFLAEEIVRTLVGSLGLVAAVPISTLVAALIIVHQERLGGWRAVLGPVTRERGEAGHSH